MQIAIASKGVVVAEEELLLCSSRFFGKDEDATCFRATISRLRESYADIELYHGGQHLTDMDCGYSRDQKGFLSSIEMVMEEANRICRTFTITPQSSLVLAVKVTVMDTPVAPHVSAKSYPSGPQYVSVPSDWRLYNPDKIALLRATADQEKRAEIEKDLMISRKTVLEEQVWDSKTGGDLALATPAELKSLIDGIKWKVNHGLPCHDHGVGIV